jgi:hypothetical protein
MRIKRFSPSPLIRSFGDQVETFCLERKALKQDVAADAGVSPSRLAHALRYGASSNVIEKIANALRVHPSHFDVYVAQEAEVTVLEHPEILPLLRDITSSSCARKRLLLKQIAALKGSVT